MDDDNGTLTAALGWASLALGASQTLAPGAFLRFVGARDDPGGRLITVGACGVRELGAAAGILAVERPEPVQTLRARVAGDALDLALLARALRNRPRRPGRLVGALLGTAGITAADVAAVVRQTRSHTSREVHRMNQNATITVRCSEQEAQRRWRELATDPAGPLRLAPVEILDEDPGRRLVWRTAGGTGASGVVVFVPAPGDQGTELHVDLTADVAGGVVTEAVHRLKGDDPLQQVNDDLRRCKQIVETGEVARSEATPGGHSASQHVHQRPAQPVGHPNA